MAWSGNSRSGAESTTRNETFQTEGWFWRPGHEDNKFPGHVTYSTQTGGELILTRPIGHITDLLPLPGFGEESVAYRVVAGGCAQGRRITALRAGEQSGDLGPARSTTCSGHDAQRHRGSGPDRRNTRASDQSDCRGSG
jgi:hypothetical protein